MKRDTIVCTCSDFIKPVIKSIQCDTIAMVKQEIFEAAKRYNGFINEDTISFTTQKDFNDFWSFIMTKM